MNNNFKKWIDSNKDIICPYAHSLTNVIDGRTDTIEFLKNISSTSVVLIDIDISHQVPKLEQMTNNQYFCYDNFVVVIPKSEYLIAQRELYEAGYYDNKDQSLQDEIEEKFRFVYPIKKQRNQTLGTESRYKIYIENFNEPGSVLDFGGGAANLFYHKLDTITKYSCVDVHRKNIAVAKKMYPSANFYHWDRFNYMYNATGIRDLEFPNIELHDYTFINSVFPCTDLYDMIYILKEVKKVTKKKILFTFFSNKNIQTLENFYNSFYDNSKKTIDITKWSSYNNNIFYLLNTDIEILDKEKVELNLQCDNFLSAYNVDYLQDRLEKELDVKIIKQDPCLADDHFTAFIINLEKEI